MLQTLGSEEFLVRAEATLRRGQRFRFRAAGTSMEPFIRSGDTLIVDPVDDQTIRLGDVALYRSAEGPRAHRVTGRTGAAFRVQGDAPGCIAEQVDRGDVLGRVGIVERGGKSLRLDRGLQRMMRWPVVRLPVGRRLSRTLAEWSFAAGERSDRDGEDIPCLLKLCSPSARLNGDLRWNAAKWERMAALAETHELAPLFHYQTRGRGSVPPEAARLLSSAYYVSAARYAVLTDRLGPVLGALRGAGLPAMVLKGPALAETAYPSPATRPMTDVDLLVRPHHVGAADGVLAALGYRPVDGPVENIDPASPTSLSTLDYRSSDPLAPPVHLHWHLVNTSIPTETYRDHIVMDEVWNEAWPLAMAGERVWRMAPHHRLVYLCEHALRPAHALWNPLLVTDLAWSVARDSPDWDRVLDVSRRFRLDRIAFFVLRVVRDLTDAPVPESVIASLVPARVTVGERVFLRRALRGRSRPGTSYFVHLALRRTLFKKAGFLFRTIFPSRPVVAHHTAGRSWGWYLERSASALTHALGRG